MPIIYWNWGINRYGRHAELPIDTANKRRVYDGLRQLVRRSVKFPPPLLTFRVRQNAILMFADTVTGGEDTTVWICCDAACHTWDAKWVVASLHPHLGRHLWAAVELEVVVCGCKWAHGGVKLPVCLDAAHRIK